MLLRVIGKRNKQRALPLADPEVRGHLNTLFLEGKLKPISLPEGWQVAEEWTTIGIEQQYEVEGVRRFNHLLQQLKQTIPAAGKQGYQRINLLKYVPRSREFEPKF